MAHPKQNTQVIVKQLPNVAPHTIDSQLAQAKAAFSAAKSRLITPPRSNKKSKFVPPAVGDRMSMLKPRHRTDLDKERGAFPMLLSTNSQQCRVVSKVISQMFPAVNQEALA